MMVENKTAIEMEQADEMAKMAKAGGQVCDLADFFAPVIGYKSIKKELIRICDIMRNRDFYAKLGVSVPSGLLLSGEPGLGKTLMANCFIKASGRTAFVCRKDKPDGDFVKHIKNTFEEAVKFAPSIVFLDDMDKFANGDEYHKNSEEFVTVQSCIDDCKGKEVFVLATINDNDSIPSSLLRAGRFDNRIEVQAPKGADAAIDVFLEPGGGLLKRIHGFGCDSIAAGDPQQNRRPHKRARTEHYARFLFQDLPCRKDCLKINAFCSSRGSRVRPLQRPCLRPLPKAGRPQV
jgi:AAA+ superfamily predicted ATPase